MRLSNTQIMEQLSQGREERRAELYWAFRTRPLTDAEMAVVEILDYTITIASGETWNEETKKLELRS